MLDSTEVPKRDVHIVDERDREIRSNIPMLIMVAALGGVIAATYVVNLAGWSHSPTKVASAPIVVPAKPPVSTHGAPEVRPAPQKGVPM